MSPKDYLSPPTSDNELEPGSSAASSRRTSTTDIRYNYDNYWKSINGVDITKGINMMSVDSVNDPSNLHLQRQFHTAIASSTSQ